MKKYAKYGIIIGGAIAIIMLFIDGKNIKIGKEIENKLRKEDPVIFSAFFREEDEQGTYLYDFNQESKKKISDELFFEISYNEDRTKFVGIMKENVGSIKKNHLNSFIGIIEYDMETNVFTPVISIKEMRELFENPDIEIAYDIHDPQYYQEGYTILCEDKILYIKKEGEQWEISTIGRAFDKDGWTSYRWDKDKENIYVNVKTDAQKWKLAKYREYLLDDSIQFSSGGDLAFYVEKTYGAIDRESMHKFFVVDLKTNRVRMIKDWKREASFYGISW